jgi:glycosyltransferase 2 family protein
MKRYRYAAGALLSVLLTALAIVLITVKIGEMPHVVSAWPLFAALGVSAVTWWLQGLIVAVLARPQLKSLQISGMVRVYMAGGFIWGISPIKGAEVPFEVYLLKRFGLSAGEGSTVVITRVLLDIMILAPAALGGLVLTSNLPNAESPALLLAGSTIAGLIAATTLLMRKRGRRKLRSRERRPGGSGWRARGWTKIFCFFGDMQRSLALFWRRGYRATLIYGGILAVVYWAFRLSLGPLSLMATGWSGDWVPVIVAQLLLFSLVLPLAPTPGGSGAREFGFAALMTTYVPGEQLLSGTIVYTCLAHYLPVLVGAFFAGRQLWQGSAAMTSGRQKAADSLGRGCECLDQRAVPVRAYNDMQR